MNPFPLSPLDGRYAARVAQIAPLFSEFGLAKARTQVEIQWLFFLSEKGMAPEIEAETRKKLQGVHDDFSEDDFAKIKEIEATTNHDVKAVEYFLREKTPQELWSWIHFACTSEDINNTSYGLILKMGRAIILEVLEEIQKDLRSKSLEWKSIPMLCRTHGQTATPSTMGKEIAIFYARVKEIAMVLQNRKITAKINGATGTYGAHMVAFPHEDWIKLSEEFITQKLELDFIPLTSQIEPHDNQAAILNDLSQISAVLIDLCRDIWGYVSMGFFGQRVIAGEVGSSTMPHKVNPIDFENAEGNLKLARGIARTLADELPISRWQRDLTDSTLQRNFGLVFGHFLLALKSLQKGLGKLDIKEEVLWEDLQNAPEVLTEAVQTVLRKHGHHDAYEQLKEFSRGKKLDLPSVKAFVDSTDLPEEAKQACQMLTPEQYTGHAALLVERFVK